MINAVIFLTVLLICLLGVIWFQSAVIHKLDDAVEELLEENQTLAWETDENANKYVEEMWGGE